MSITENHTEYVLPDNELAYNILSALRNSTFAEELDHYREDIQDDLGLTEDVMNRLFHFDALVFALRPREPERLYHGRRVKSVARKKDERMRERTYAPTQVVEVDPQPVDTVDELGDVNTETVVVATGTMTEPVVTEEVTEDVVTEKVTEPVVVTKQLASKAARESTSLSDYFEKIKQDNSDNSDTDSANSDDEIEKEIDDEVEEETELVKQTETPPVKDKSAKALRKLLRSKDVDVTGLTFDTVTYEKALILTGHTKPIRATLRATGGKWNRKLKGFVFTKEEVISEAKDLKKSRSSEEDTQETTEIVEAV